MGHVELGLRGLGYLALAMNRDGKINDGIGYVHRIEDGPILIAVLERWLYVHGPDPAAHDVEYILGLGSGQ